MTNPNFIPLSDPRREGHDFPHLQRWMEAVEERERAIYSDPRRSGNGPTRRDDWRYINHERKQKEKET